MDRGHAAPSRILVVDDEPSIRLLCRLNLELDGHEVLEAGSLAEARAALEEGVDVVILDLHLRGEHGGALVEECHALHPPVPVVLVTGSVETSAAGPLKADVVLGKPFDVLELLAVVHRLAGEHVSA